MLKKRVAAAVPRLFSPLRTPCCAAAAQRLWMVARRVGFFGGVGRRVRYCCARPEQIPCRSLSLVRPAEAGMLASHSGGSLWRCAVAAGNRAEFNHYFFTYRLTFALWRRILFRSFVTPNGADDEEIRGLDLEGYSQWPCVVGHCAWDDLRPVCLYVDGSKGRYSGIAPGYAGIATGYKRDCGGTRPP